MVCTKNDRKIAVVNILGQSGFNRVHLSNPFIFLPKLVEKIQNETKTIIVDFHAAPTAEKITMFYLIDGKVSALLGTHNKVLTTDEKVLDRGTAVITDTGRTGSLNSVGGLDPEIEIRKFLTQIPERSRAYWESLELQGVIIHIDTDGKARHIERVRVPCEERPNDYDSDSARS